MALWLLDSQHLGRNQGVKRIAGRLLKQPAREGVVEAQSRLGRLLCCECDSQRDRRIGFELLRQAARQVIARRSWSSAACAVNRITPSRRRHGSGWSRPRRRVRMRRQGFCGRSGADRHPCLTGVQRVAILPGNFAGALHVP